MRPDLEIPLPVWRRDDNGARVASRRSDSHFGTFSTAEEAVEACRKIVDDWLESHSLGEDLFVVPIDHAAAVDEATCPTIPGCQCDIAVDDVGGYRRIGHPFHVVTQPALVFLRMGLCKGASKIRFLVNGSMPARAQYVFFSRAQTSPPAWVHRLGCRRETSRFFSRCWRMDAHRSPQISRGHCRRIRPSCWRRARTRQDVGEVATQSTDGASR